MTREGINHLNLKKTGLRDQSAKKGWKGLRDRRGMRGKTEEGRDRKEEEDRGLRDNRDNINRCKMEDKIDTMTEKGIS